MCIESATEKPKTSNRVIEHVGPHWLTCQIHFLDVSSERGWHRWRGFHGVCLEPLIPLDIDFPLRKNIHFAGRDSCRLGRIGREVMSHFLLIDAGTAAAALTVKKMCHIKLMKPLLHAMMMHAHKKNARTVQSQDSTGGLGGINLNVQQTEPQRNLRNNVRNWQFNFPVLPSWALKTESAWLAGCRV